jgi:adenine-specific DNA-methyltransferase
MQNLYKDLIQELAKNEKFLLQGEVSASLVRDKAYKLDPELVGLLFGSERLKQEFFTETNGAMIFNYPKFAKFITNKEFLPDSYTEFESNIGLSVGDKFLSENKEVVLSFPFKDCILEGGMDTEEAKNRKEIFYNQTLAPDDIHKLKSPKALKNWKRFTAKGEIPLLSIDEKQNEKNSPLEGWQSQTDGVDSLKLNDDGTFNENFIIKGNNLLALYSLLPRYKGKVKLVYIDPPYNTGNDGFKYNDNFNHSTWLTFMKNRLEIARELLRDDGVIFVQCDDNEQAYLKVLMDEVFGRGQTDCMVWRKSGVGRDGKMKNTTTFRKDHEYIVLGFKNQKNLKKSLEKPNWENSYPNPDNDPRGNYKAGSISRTEESSNPKHKHYYTVESPSGKEFTRQFDVSKKEFEKLTEDNRIYWGINKDAVPAIKIFENEERETNTSSLILFNGTSTEGKKEIEDLFENIEEFATPKPEKLMKKLIQISTNPGDIVLDYHLGSGTTAAVAHKMGRQYIGIEQMDYIETIAVERLKKVVGKGVKSKDLMEDNVCEDFDTGGISKAVNWQGGGDFIYLELTKNNIIYLEKIEGLASGSEAWSLFEELADSIWISYRVDIDKFKEHKDQFLALELEDQKKILKDIINYNHLYVNYEDMEDEAYKDSGLSTEDKALTTQFYEKKPTDQNELL